MPWTNIAGFMQANTKLTGRGNQMRFSRLFLKQLIGILTYSVGGLIFYETLFILITHINFLEIYLLKESAIRLLGRCLLFHSKASYC